MRLFRDDGQVLQALLMLTHDANFQTVLQHLALFAEERTKALIYERDDGQRVLYQGQLQVIVELIDGVNNAPKRLNILQEGERIHGRA